MSASPSPPAGLRLQLWGWVPPLVLLYGSTMSRVSTIDALYYYETIERGALRDRLHPHHLIFELLQKLWFEGARWLGYTGRADLAAKSMSLVASTALLILFARTLSRLFGAGRLAGGMLLLYGVTYVAWHFASEAEPVVFFALFSLWSLDLVLRRAPGRPVSPGQAVGLALVNGIGALFHQALIFTAPFSLLALWRSDAASRRKALALYAVVLAAVVAGPYLLAATLGAGARNPREILDWARSYSVTFAGEYGRLTSLTPLKAVRGLAGSFVGGTAVKGYFNSPRGLDAGLVLGLVPFVCTGVFLAVAGIAAARLLRRTSPGRAVLAWAGAWVLVFGGFAVWWMPENRNFWAPVMPALLIGAAAAFHEWPAAGGFARFRGLLLGLLIGVLTLGNLTGGILHKHRSRDSEQSLWRRLEPVHQPGDLVVLRADRVWLALRFYQREIGSLGLYPPTEGRDESQEPAWREAADRAARRLEEGHRLFLAAGLGPVFLDMVGERLEGDPRLWAEPLFEYGDSELQGRPAQTLLVVRPAPPPR